MQSGQDCLISKRMTLMSRFFHKQGYTIWLLEGQDHPQILVITLIKNPACNNSVILNKF